MRFDSRYEDTLTGSTAGPAVVEVRSPHATSKMRGPFVLKCPECTAPAESGQRQCRYCKVPFTWEPVLPLSFDSELDEALHAHAAEGLILPFGPLVLLSAAKTVFDTMPQIPICPEVVYFPMTPERADAFVVHDIRIGYNSQLRASVGPIPGRIFAEHGGVRGFARDEFVSVGMRISLVVENVSARAENFHAIIRGRSPERIESARVRGVDGRARRAVLGTLVDWQRSEGQGARAYATSRRW